MSVRQPAFRRAGLGGRARRLAAIYGLAVAAPFLSAGAQAQTAGEAPSTAQQHEGDCAVMGGCGQSRGSASPVEISHWAAIAYSPSTLRSGSSGGQTSAAAAKQLALRNCAAAAADCALLDWGSDLCFALAVSRPDDVYGQAVDRDRAGAAAKAITLCRNVKGQNCVVQASPCANDDPRWPAPLPLPPPLAGSVASVDPNTVGTWELLMNPGIWVWEIGPDGTYEFHSEAPDGVPSQAGIFSASGGHWSMQATAGYPDSDGGSYMFQSPDTMIATGRLGTGTWRRLPNGDPDP
jgi:Domain of unknown function (DUF4189)